MRRLLLAIVLLTFATPAASRTLVPMDLSQRDHLRAYGLAYWCLEQGFDVEWLLNYRGGSFLMPESEVITREAAIRGVSVETIGGAQLAQMRKTIEEENMESVLLEKAPKVAVYVPPTAEPWDDAVRLALDYADIPYTTLYDREVLAGDLDEYDWLHLHHEDFTGQYGKFYASFRNADWYREQVRSQEQLAHELGFNKVSSLKKAVALEVQKYVGRGGFLFAMCSATDTYDIALAAADVDICASVFDGDPPQADYASRLDYSRCLAFQNFSLITDPMVYEFSNLDTSNYAARRGAEAEYFTLFDFSAKYDPVPAMLTQNHVSVVKGFLGQTTGFHKEFIKDSVILLGQVEGTDEVKYLHGNYGRGTFTFLGGHDPEDYQHQVGDPPTDLSLHRNSPGYRLILNNILFPAAKKKERKT
jgi:hypothetical protein